MNKPPEKIDDTMALSEQSNESASARPTQERPKSGTKFRTPQGTQAIKDGVKQHTSISAQPKSSTDRKPPWLRVKLPSGGKYEAVKETVNQHTLETVCQESHCPNIGECWSNGTATIMLMGSVCTRACQFCAVDTGNPQGWLDHNEPHNAAESVRLMKLRYVVLTSVDRDDLADGGASHYAACIRAIKQVNPNTAVEALTPDFNGDQDAIQVVVNSGLEVFAQNVETVRRLTHPVRDPRAGYQQTLDVLATAKKINPQVLTKSSLMLGLGESMEEVKQALRDLRLHEVDIVTFGQYLRPTLNHLPVARWVHPDEFAEIRQWGLAQGFTEIASGPLVRSSYRADQILDRNNLGLPGTIPLTNL